MDYPCNSQESSQSFSILQPQPQKRIKKLDKWTAKPTISMNRLKTAAELPVFPNSDVAALRLTMALRVGPDPWTEYHAAIGEPLELQVPDGGLALQVSKKGCTGDRNSAGDRNNVDMMVYTYIYIYIMGMDLQFCSSWEYIPIMIWILMWIVVIWIMDISTLGFTAAVHSWDFDP